MKQRNEYTDVVMWLCSRLIIYSKYTVKLVSLHMPAHGGLRALVKGPTVTLMVVVGLEP